MSDPRQLLIVGAGMAGAKAAETLRSEGFDGRVVLIGQEPVPPYDRVPLSKHYLRGDPGGHQLFIHDDGYYRDHDIELRLDSKVVALDLHGRHVSLESGERLGYDALLLATGSAPRRLDVPGAQLDGVHYLRELHDSDRLRETLVPAARIVVIGAGWIGCEVAASARLMGVEVALVAPGRLPLERPLGPEMGAFYRDLHASHGVELHLEAAVYAIRGHGRAEEVALADGRVLAADAVVVGIGAEPRVALAQQAGLPVDNGILTDEQLATEVPGVFAAGDVARAWHPRLQQRMRLEHWSSALNQGPAAARGMLGHPTVYDRIPFFFSDQYDVGMEYTGYARDWDDAVFRGDRDSGEFLVFWLRQGQVVAGMNVNVWDVRDDIAALIAAGVQVDPVALADARVDLPGLLTSGAAR